MMEDDPTQFQTSLGETVTKVRRTRRLSIAELAELSGISRQHLWRIERGSVRSPGKEVLERLAGALSVSANVLIPTFVGRERTLNVLVENASRIQDEDWELVKQIATCIQLELKSGVPTLRPRQERIGRISIAPPESTSDPKIPDDLKIIAQFFARREGRPAAWLNYTKEAFKLRTELKRRGHYKPLDHTGDG